MDVRSPRTRAGPALVRRRQHRPALRRRLRVYPGRGRRALDGGLALRARGAARPARDGDAARGGARPRARRAAGRHEDRGGARYGGGDGAPGAPLRRPRRVRALSLPRGRPGARAALDARRARGAPPLARGSPRVRRRGGGRARARGGRARLALPARPPTALGDGDGGTALGARDRHRRRARPAGERGVRRVRPLGGARRHARDADRAALPAVHHGRVRAPSPGVRAAPDRRREDRPAALPARAAAFCARRAAAERPLDRARQLASRHLQPRQHARALAPRRTIAGVLGSRERRQQHPLRDVQHVLRALRARLRCVRGGGARPGALRRGAGARIPPGVYSTSRLAFSELRRTAFVAVQDAIGPVFADSGIAAKDAAAAEAVGRFATAADPRPFFAVLLLESTHAGYDFDPAQARYRPYSERIGFLGPGAGVRPPPEWNRYRNAVAYADTVVGGLVDWLDAHGLLATTVVVVTGDHGEEFNEHGYWGHNGAFTPEQLRVPLVLYVPGLAPARHQ